MNEKEQQETTESKPEKRKQKKITDFINV